MLTRTPSSSVGSLPSTISSARQKRVVGARFSPKMLTQPPAAIPGTKLAPLSTPSCLRMVGSGGSAAGFRV